MKSSIFSLVTFTVVMLFSKNNNTFSLSYPSNSSHVSVCNSNSLSDPSNSSHVSVCNSILFDLTTNSTWEFYSKNKLSYICSMYKNKLNNTNFCGVIFSVNEDQSTTFIGKIRANLNHDKIIIEINEITPFIVEHNPPPPNDTGIIYTTKIPNKFNIDELNINCNSNTNSNNCCITSSYNTQSETKCNHKDNLVYLSGFINKKMVTIIVDNNPLKENIDGYIYLFSTNEKIGKIQIKGKLGCFNDDYKVDIEINIDKDKYSYNGTFKYTSVDVKSGLNLLTLSVDGDTNTPMIFVRCFYEVNFDNSSINCSITKNKSCSITKNKNN